ncbi:hypothetical protein GCM10011495_03930 [Hymenobacter frigidus]|uniref:CobB/CobQ-like glutamine amidotransferase domain-containing protein n=1 Tax=Hymenobacter frigidus TaxID=1524095 RepID=A0ABQ1ZUM6_9BACT|nr:hypothetical protein [Hymenobacter frigidus]GGH79743.1 hypothetical protein GCM10011495_03930 [Hymenobacter frigidus]
MPASSNSKPGFLRAAPAISRPGRCRIAEARDAVFAFTYHQNPPVPAALGKVTYFSLQADAVLFAGTDYFCICLGISLEPANITSAKGVAVPAQLHRQGNVWASCVHLYWGEDAGFIRHLIAGGGGGSATTIAP